MKIEDEDVEMEVSDGYEEKQLENSQRIIESLDDVKFKQDDIVEAIKSIEPLDHTKEHKAVDSTTTTTPVIWTSGAMSANTVPFPIPLYSLPFSTGLRLIVSGANAAATVIYE